jgi:hypothetical protein
MTEALEAVYASRIETADSFTSSIRVDMARLLVKLAAQYKLSDETGTILAIYREVKHPLLKADAAVSLGQLRAVAYAPILARDLTDLNLTPVASDAAGMEARAYGLVQALELMRDPVGFTPVFIASIGWYSHASQVRQIAQAALATMVDDPTSQLSAIVTGDADLSHKQAALETTAASKAAADKKAGVARAALAAGLDAHTDKVAAQLAQSKLRSTAVAVLVATQDKSTESVALYSRWLDWRGASQDELLACYTALGANGGAEAVTLLVQRMADFNQRQKAGLNTASDRLLIMQVIASLKAAGRPEARPVLLDAEYSNHDSAVARAARTAALP